MAINNVIHRIGFSVANWLQIGDVSYLCSSIDILCSSVDVKCSYT